MLNKLYISSILTLLILDISVSLESKPVYKNGLITKFCVASLKSKLNLTDKKKISEISNFTCECFFKKYKSGSTMKNSRIYCRNKAVEKYNL